MGKTIMKICGPTSPSYITPIKDFIEHGSLPPDPSEVVLIKKRSSGYTIVGGTPYNKGLSTPLLRYLEKAENNYAFLKVHKGLSGNTWEPLPWPKRS